jgi:phosphogluconate 2-dehydrogenase
MRIALDQRFRDVAHRQIQGHEIVFYDSATSAAFLTTAGDAQVLGCAGPAPWRFDEQIIAALPNLRFIHKIGAGTDWFDVEALNRHGVLLATNTGLNAISVADHLVMLMLICLRSAIDPIVAMRRGEWVHVPADRIVEVEDAAVGIIGLGKIGSQVARRVLAFGEVRVLGHQRSPIDSKTTPGVRSATLDELLRESDIVFVCVPLTSETHKLIGTRELALMKPGSMLINASRGRVVDESALYDALASGHLRAAASDVFEIEPTPPDNPLLKLLNFIGTPHMAGRSRRNSPRQLMLALENINVFLAGQRPERLINPHIYGDVRL